MRQEHEEVSRKERSFSAGRVREALAMQRTKDLVVVHCISAGSVKFYFSRVHNPEGGDGYGHKYCKYRKRSSVYSVQKFIRCFTGLPIAPPFRLWLLFNGIFREGKFNGLTVIADVIIPNALFTLGFCWNGSNNTESRTTNKFQ